MKKVEILLIALTVSACATQTPQQTTQIQGVGDPHEIQKAPTSIEIAAVTPELPELKKEENIEPEKELTFHEKIERIFYKGCVIDIETYDLSGITSLENLNKKYRPNSTITVVAVWYSLTNKKCGVKIDENNKRYHQIVHEEDGIIALDFMQFNVVRDKFGYDQIDLIRQGPSIKKEVADKINWNRVDKVNFANRRYGERLYMDGLHIHPIHKSMKDRIYKRWEEK